MPIYFGNNCVITNILRFQRILLVFLDLLLLNN